MTIIIHVIQNILFCHLNYIEEASWLIAKQVVAAGSDLESSTDDENFDEHRELQNFLTGNLH